MPYRLILAVAILALALSACAGKANPTESTASAAQPTQQAAPPSPLPTAGPGIAPATSLPTPQINIPVGCQTYTLKDPGATDEPGRFPTVQPGEWSRGPQDAPVTLIVYSDYQCPSCADLQPLLQQLQDSHPGQVRVVFRHFPLIGFPDNPIHDKAALAMQAAEAAGWQNGDFFWAMHNLLFARQELWRDLSPAEFETWLVEQASELALDMEAFKAALTSPELSELAQAAWIQGVASNLRGTPSLVINDSLLEGVPLTFSAIDFQVRLILLEEIQYATCPIISIDQSKRYLATLSTAYGDIVVELFADRAPITVNNFVFLAREGFYDGVTFHKVLPGFLAQTGDPSGTGFGGPGYTFVDEITNGLNFDRAGVLAMANSGPDTNGSQFFITLAPAPQLNGGYTIFGQVINGIEVLLQLAPRNPDLGMNLPPGDVMISVSIMER
jgi:cyclophilin family peptidyl-prolyl cis-trans isomerase/predicted DsbA family dithiol-disulfide isomerase